MSIVGRVQNGGRWGTGGRWGFNERERECTRCFLRIIKQDAEENKSEPNRIEYRTLNEDIWPDTDKGGNENFKNTLCKSGNAEESHRGRTVKNQGVSRWKYRRRPWMGEYPGTRLGSGILIIDTGQCLQTPSLSDGLSIYPKYTKIWSQNSDFFTTRILWKISNICTVFHNSFIRHDITVFIYLLPSLLFINTLSSRQLARAMNLLQMLEIGMWCSQRETGLGPKIQE